MPTPDAKKILAKFDWDSFNKSLQKELGDGIYTVLNAQGARGARAVGAKWNPDDPFVKKTMTGYVGQLITELDDTTKDDVAALIQNELEAAAGETVLDLGDKIADLIQEKFDGYADWRADRIARTETAIAYNNGNVLGYRQGGVEEVEVSDGDDDDDCAAVDGQIWSVEEALAEPIAHPNCTRDFAPVLPDEEDD